MFYCECVYRSKEEEREQINVHSVIQILFVRDILYVFIVIEIYVYIIMITI